MSEEVEGLLWDAVEALVSAINWRNKTEMHSVLTTSYALKLADAYGINKQELVKVRLACLLHDIGQIVYPDTLISKQGEPLTPEEREVIHSHTYVGADLIKQWSSLDFIRPYMLYHQEWIDGSGYPFGVTANDISIEVQILSIGDVYEALRHSRLFYHRAALSHSDAITEMRKMEGRWDTKLLDLFIDISSTWPD